MTLQTINRSKHLKFTHCFAIACVIASLALFVAGFSGVANFALGLAAVVEILGSAITGKQSNDTER